MSQRVPPPSALPPEFDPRGPRHRRVGGPPPGGRSHRPGGRGRRVSRALSWLAVALSAVLLVVSVGGWTLYTYYQGRLGRVDISLPGLAQPAPTAAQNFLLVGSDTRNFAGGAAFQGSGASYVTGQRSDTIMLLHIPAGNGRITLVSFPRDSWVQIPAYTDGHGVAHPAAMGKINSAFDLGGAPLLVHLIESLSGLRVEHYVQVDFAGFQNMVNALGGVTLCVGTTRHDHDSGDYLTAGVHYVDGAQALAFVRDRKGLPLGDIDRIKDQQYFLAQMMKKVLSAGTLTNPFELNGFLRAVTSSITVDQGFGFAQLQTLATRLRHLDPAHVNLVTLPYTTADGYADGQSVVEINYPAAQALFAGLRNDGAAPAAKPAGKPAPTVPPSSVHVTVLNGSGRAGLARDTAQALTAEGFAVSSVGNASSSDVAHTLVRYGPGEQAAAQTVADATGATIVADPSLGATVTLTLGGDFTAVHALPGAGGAGTTPATPTAPTTPTAAATTAAAATCAP